MDRLLLTVNEVAEALGCGRTFVYELIRNGDLPAIKLGRLTRVPVAGVDELIAKAGMEALEARKSGRFEFEF